MTDPKAPCPPANGQKTIGEGLQLHQPYTQEAFESAMTGKDVFTGNYSFNRLLSFYYHVESILFNIRGPLLS